MPDTRSTSLVMLQSLLAVGVLLCVIGVCYVLWVDWHARHKRKK